MRNSVHYKNRDLFLLGVTLKNCFLLSFCTFSYNLDFLLGVLAIAKFPQPVFFCGRTSKISHYDLLPAPHRVVFLLAVTSKSKFENFRMFC